MALINRVIGKIPYSDTGFTVRTAVVIYPFV